MAGALRPTLRFKLANPARYAANLARAEVRHRLAGGPRPVRWLLLSDDLAYTSEQQWAPLRRWAGDLRQRLGIVARHIRISVDEEIPSGLVAGYDAVALKLSWKTPADRAVRTAARLRELTSRHGAMLTYFDGDDDLCIHWPDLLAHVDLYVKKHIFADTRNYLRPYIGKSNLTDHVARTFGISFAEDPIPETRPVPEEHLHKLVLGWNIGLDDKIVDLANRTAAGPAVAKDVDLVCRASVPRTHWIYPLRHPVLEHLQGLAGRFNVLAPTDRVPQDQYYREMLRSRICVSPFGYGEICWRDFEAVACGCLLVKPDMSHLRTRPSIFEPGETYVPVRWDFSDLEEVCARYLEDEPARCAIADRALAVLRSRLTADWFVDVFRELLSRMASATGGPAGAKPALAAAADGQGPTHA